MTLVDTENPQRSHPGAHTEAAVRWSSEHLYVAFWCHFSELNLYLGEDAGKERWELWNRDVAEVFLTPYPEVPNRYWEFEVAPNNMWIDLAVEKREEISLDVGWDSGFEHATSMDDKSKMWTCEMRIPAVSLGINRIERGMEWRINFYRCDGFGDNSQRRFLAWSPTFQLNFMCQSVLGGFEWRTSVGCDSALGCLQNSKSALSAWKHFAICLTLRPKLKAKINLQRCFSTQKDVLKHQFLGSLRVLRSDRGNDGGVLINGVGVALAFAKWQSFEVKLLKTSPSQRDKPLQQFVSARLGDCKMEANLCIEEPPQILGVDAGALYLHIELHLFDELRGSIARSHFRRSTFDEQPHLV